MVDAVLTPLTTEDFPTIRGLAHAIWHEHYAAIIGPDQIDFMLAARTSDAALRAYVRANDRWFDVLRVGGVPVGYCSHAFAAASGVLKLEQLYVAAAQRGRGLGLMMLDHVERHARSLGGTEIVLQVNKRNAPAIGFYRGTGFVVRESAVFEIAGGYVMDDYVMVKTLS